MVAKFKGSCFKQNKTAFTQGNKVNLCIVYELDVWSRYLNTKFILVSYLFRAVKLTKSTKHDKYRYS